MVLVLISDASFRVNNSRYNYTVITYLRKIKANKNISPRKDIQTIVNGGLHQGFFTLDNC